MTNYYKGWKNEPYQCSACRWSGLGEDLTCGEEFRDLFEAHCPKCDKKLGLILYNSIEEYRGYWNRLSAEDKKVIEESDRLAKEISESKALEAIEFLNRLRNTLPDLGSDPFVLVWDIEGSHDSQYVLRFGKRVIWRERAYWEDWKTFVTLLKVLKERYGSAILDVIPTPAACSSLGGDELQSTSYMDSARQMLRRQKS